MDPTTLTTGLAAADIAKQRVDRIREVREAAEGFEALLYRELLSAMRQAQLDEGLFGDSPGGGTMEGLFEMTLSQALGRTGSLGLAEAMAEQLVGSAPAPGRTALERLHAALDQVSGPRADEYGGGLSTHPTDVPVEGVER